MTHPGYESQVDLLLDGELTPADARELEAHIADARSARASVTNGSRCVPRSPQAFPPSARRMPCVIACEPRWRRRVPRQRAPRGARRGRCRDASPATRPGVCR